MKLFHEISFISNGKMGIKLLFGKCSDALFNVTQIVENIQKVFFITISVSFYYS